MSERTQTEIAADVLRAMQKHTNESLEDLRRLMLENVGLVIDRLRLGLDQAVQFTDVACAEAARMQAEIDALKARIQQHEN
ncbi:MAG TPA: hypothetical protein P5081_17610 [Phycisphaerae bacterium]|nr:hypothetical protein [Phycisphaerae bacterium]HRW54689.1 hypothetical protein [Phycisphaerae bacterium]